MPLNIDQYLKKTDSSQDAIKRYLAPISELFPSSEKFDALGELLFGMLTTQQYIQDQIQQAGQNASKEPLYLQFIMNVTQAPKEVKYQPVLDIKPWPLMTLITQWLGKRSLYASNPEIQIYWQALQDHSQEDLLATFNTASDVKPIAEFYQKLNAYNEANGKEAIDAQPILQAVQNLEASYIAAIMPYVEALYHSQQQLIAILEPMVMNDKQLPIPTNPFSHTKIEGELTDSTFDTDINPKTLSMVVFSMPHCPPCETQKKNINTISNDGHDLDIYTLDITQNPEVAKRYGTTGTPTTLLLKNGNILEKFVGPKSPDDMRSLIAKHNRALPMSERIVSRLGLERWISPPQLQAAFFYLTGLFTGYVIAKHVYSPCASCTMQLPPSVLVPEEGSECAGEQGSSAMLSW